MTFPITNPRSLAGLRRAAKECEACPLYRHATQTVFGEGRKSAQLFIVGEQPGDHEDRAGKPFVGPAGRLLDKALAEAGIDRAEAYVTNAVKHFKFEPRGKRRLHKKPSAAEVAACRPWLEAELAVVRPHVLICLGATAAQSLLGRDIKVMRDRGKIFRTSICAHTLVTVHPSSLLRMPNPAEREAAYRLFVADLEQAARVELSKS